MRVCALVLLLTIGALGGAREVHAEKVKTNQATKVRAKPGEQEKVLLKLKSGQTMTVLSKDGRWLKVRVQGRTGYVPRSTVDMPDDDEIARNTRRRPFVDGRSTKRGFGGEQGPDDRVGADATGDGGSDDSDSGSGSKATAKVAASSKGKGGDDDDDDDSGGKAKAKPAAKTATKASAKPAKGDDDDDDDSGGKAKPKVAAKTSAKATAKPAKGSDDDDDDDSGSKAKASSSKSKSDDDDEDTTKVSDDDKDAGDGGNKRATAHVSAKVVAFNEHDQESGEAFTAKPSEVLYPGETKGKWTFVETDDGDAGWVLSSQLDLDGGETGGGGTRRRTIALDAAIGATFLQQTMSTVGSTITGPSKFPDSYTISTSAFSVGVGGNLVVPYGKSLLLGGQGTFQYSLSTPGIDVPPLNGTTTSTNEGVTLVDVNLRGLVGYDFHKPSGLAVFGRLGYRYDAFLAAGNTPFNVMQNPAKIPSEATQGPTIGAALAIPRLTPKIGVDAAVDAMLFGASVKQTTALDDGLKPTATLYSIHAGLVYRWRSMMDFRAAYLLGLGSYDFGAPDPASMRGHTGTDVKRSDIYNTITVGLAKGF